MAFRDFVRASDRTTKALLAAIALGVWTLIVVEVTQRTEADYSCDIDQISADVRDLQDTTSTIDSHLSSLTTSVDSMELDVSAIRRSVQSLEFR